MTEWHRRQGLSVRLLTGSWPCGVVSPAAGGAAPFPCAPGWDRCCQRRCGAGPAGWPQVGPLDSPAARSWVRPPSPPHPHGGGGEDSWRRSVHRVCVALWWAVPGGEYYGGCRRLLTLRPPSLPVSGLSPLCLECIPQATSWVDGHIPQPPLSLPCIALHIPPGPAASWKPFGCLSSRSPASRSRSESPGCWWRLAAQPPLCFQSPRPPSSFSHSPGQSETHQSPGEGPLDQRHTLICEGWAPGSPGALCLLTSSQIGTPHHVEGSLFVNCWKSVLLVCPRPCGWCPCCGD